MFKRLQDGMPRKPRAIFSRPYDPPTMIFYCETFITIWRVFLH